MRCKKATLPVCSKFVRVLVFQVLLRGFAEPLQTLSTGKKFQTLSAGKKFPSETDAAIDELLFFQVEV